MLIMVVYCWMCFLLTLLVLAVHLCCWLSMLNLTLLFCIRVVFIDMLSLIVDGVVSMLIEIVAFMTKVWLPLLLI